MQFCKLLKFCNALWSVNRKPSKRSTHTNSTHWSLVHLWATTTKTICIVIICNHRFRTSQALLITMDASEIANYCFPGPHHALLKRTAFSSVNLPAHSFSRFGWSISFFSFLVLWVTGNARRFTYAEDHHNNAWNFTWNKFKVNCHLTCSVETISYYDNLDMAQDTFTRQISEQRDR